MVMKLVLVLNNIRSTYNVGAILRTAEGLGVAKVVYAGYTPRYDDNSLLPHLRAKLNRQIERSAIGAEKMVAQETASDLEKWLDAQKEAYWTVVGLENNLAPEEQERRVILDSESEQKLAADKIVLVLGEEVNGIPASIREKMDYFLEIPMAGRKESFNVSVATGIALWGLLK